jgi:uncharacterized membrane protein
MKTKDKSKKIWNSQDNPENWKWGLFYYKKLDKRIFPPKRIPMMGWTINFANPYSYLVFLGILVSVFVMILIDKYLI